MFLKSKSVEQVATLPFVISRDGIEILLITSRDRGRWILPKGWPTTGQSLPHSAALEAREEAGILGPVDETPIGSYFYQKEMPNGYSVRCHTFVYPMLVRQHCLDWPERKERKMQWCPLHEAAGIIDEAHLSRVLTDLINVDGAPLKALLSTLIEAEFENAGNTHRKKTDIDGGV